MELLAELEELVCLGFDGDDEPPTTSSMSASRLLLLRFGGEASCGAVAVRERRCAELDELRLRGL